MGITSLKMTNVIAANVSTNFDDRKIKEKRYKVDCYILHTVLLANILLLIITIICYHFTSKIKTKRQLMHWKKKRIKTEFKTVCIKNFRWKITRKYVDLWRFM